MDGNERGIDLRERALPTARSNYARFTRRGNRLYMHVLYWPGPTMVVCGLMAPVRSARLLATGQKVDFVQDRLRVRFTGLPERAPDDLVTTLVLECDGEPQQDQYMVRNRRDRADLSVGGE